MILFCSAHVHGWFDFKMLSSAPTVSLSMPPLRLFAFFFYSENSSVRQQILDLFFQPLEFFVDFLNKLLRYVICHVPAGRSV